MILPLKQELGEKIMYFFLLAFAFLLPSQWVVIPITMAAILFALIGLISKGWLDRWRGIISNKRFGWMALYYAWVGLAILYSPDAHEGEREWVVQIFLVLWPLGLAAYPPMSKSKLWGILRTFILGTLVSCLACLWMSYIDYGMSEDPSVFFYAKLAHWEMVPMHYQAMMVSFAFLIWIVDLIENQHALWVKIVSVFGIVFLLVFMGLLSIRIQFIALPIAFSAYFLVKWSWQRALAVFGGIVAVLALMIATLDGPRKRAVETMDEIASIEKVVNKKQTNHRVFIWKYGWEVISENPWTGTGTGSTQATLGPKFKESTAVFWHGYQPYKLDEFAYNYHNQFLQAWGNQGLLGLILLLGIFVGSAFSFWKEKDALSMAFITLVFFSFLTESMLLRQAGVLFMSFFVAVLWVNRSSYGKDPGKEH